MFISRDDHIHISPRTTVTKYRIKMSDAIRYSSHLPQRESASLQHNNNNTTTMDPHGPIALHGAGTGKTGHPVTTAF
jgi:hypothetical protein